MSPTVILDTDAERPRRVLPPVLIDDEMMRSAVEGIEVPCMVCESAPAEWIARCPRSTKDSALLCSSCFEAIEAATTTYPTAYTAVVCAHCGDQGRRLRDIAEVFPLNGGGCSLVNESSGARAWAEMPAEEQDRELVARVNAGDSFAEIAAWAGIGSPAWIPGRLRQARERLALAAARASEISRREEETAQVARSEAVRGLIATVDAGVDSDEQWAELANTYESLKTRKEQQDEILLRRADGWSVEALAQWAGVSRGAMEKRIVRLQARRAEAATEAEAEAEVEPPADPSPAPTSPDPVSDVDELSADESAADVATADEAAADEADTETDVAVDDDSNHEPTTTEEPIMPKDLRQEFEDYLGAQHDADDEVMSSTSDESETDLTYEILDAEPQRTRASVQVRVSLDFDALAGPWPIEIGADRIVIDLPHGEAS